MSAGFLRLCAENRVAAAHVGEDWMRPAFGVLKLDAMLFAGRRNRDSWCPATRSGRRRSARVKHRQMLIGDGLDIRCADAEASVATWRRSNRGPESVARGRTQSVDSWRRKERGQSMEDEGHA